MATNTTASPGKTFLMMALFVIIGVPLVAYLWELLNELLALKVDLIRLLIGVPVALVLYGFLKMLARRLRQWQARDVADRST